MLPVPNPTRPTRRAGIVVPDNRLGDETAGQPTFRTPRYQHVLGADGRSGMQSSRQSAEVHKPYLLIYRAKRTRSCPPALQANISESDW